MLGYLKILSQPAKADFCVFSTYFLGNFSTFCCINLKQEVEKTQKSAEAGCLKILSLPNFFFLQCSKVPHYFLIYKKISELLFQNVFSHLLTDSALCEHVTVVLD